MIPATSTNEGIPVECGMCGHSSIVDVSRPPGDSACPACGCFLWIDALAEVTRPFEFVPDLKISRLNSTTRDEAIGELTLAIAGKFNWTMDQQQAFERAVLNREDMGSTGIGRGFAVPHGKMDWIGNSISVMALAPGGIPFDALDGKPVHTIILIASPISRPQEHLQVLAKISRSLVWPGHGGS